MGILYFEFLLLIKPIPNILHKIVRVDFLCSFCPSQWFVTSSHFLNLELSQKNRMTPDMDLSHTPAGRPPPGVRPNFVDPESLRTPVIAINVIFLVLATLAVVMRVYTKRTIARAVGWDDCKCLRLGVEKYADKHRCLYTCTGKTFLGLRAVDSRGSSPYVQLGSATHSGLLIFGESKDLI